MSGSVQERLKGLIWTSPTVFVLDGVTFELIDWDLNHTADSYPVIKPRRLLDAYIETLAEGPNERVVELGIRFGGSSVFFNTLLRPRSMVCIDISKPAPPLEQYRATPAGARLKAHYRTSQDDEAALGAILQAEMDGPLDLVIDDASHFYEETKASFEILFPRLRPGGLYAIEDWSWAHHRGFTEWTDQPALSNLIFQLMMIAAGHPDLIAGITVRPGVAFVRKGAAAAQPERLAVESLCWMQNRAHQLL